jgi:hypothetical protein
VLEWLHGAAVAAILALVERHLVRMPGATHSFAIAAPPQAASLTPALG